MQGRWSSPPQLHIEEGEGGRHASWLELFFDLVFVIAVAEVAHLLHDDLTVTGFAAYVALFVPVWWLWIDFSYYADQFDTRDVLYIGAMLTAMFGMIVLALTIHKVVEGGSATFAIVYAALRVLLIALYLRAWRHVPEARELTARYSISFIIALVFWLLSLLVPEPTRFFLWGVALFIEISNGPITYVTIKSVPQQVSHMDERFGLFAIIVLGEAILAVATGVSETEWQWRAMVAAASGFVVAVALWWLYFSWADESVINRALRSNRMGLLLSFVYGYSHFFIFAAIAAVGVGSQAAIEAISEGPLSVGARLALCGGVAMFLFALSAVHWAAPNPIQSRILALRLGMATGMLALVGLGANLSPLGLMALLTALLVGLAFWESLLLPPSQALPDEGPNPEARYQEQS